MKEIVLSFLQRETVAMLVTLSPDMRPHATPVYVYVDDSFNCYCVTKESTEKYRNIVACKKVSVSFLDKNKLITSEITGDVNIVRGGEDVLVAISRLQEIMSSEKFENWLPPVAKLEGTQYAVLKIKPLNVTFANYGGNTQIKPIRIELGL
jgi:general stress protein 26